MMQKKYEEATFLLFLTSVPYESQSFIKSFETITNKNYFIK